MKKLILPLILSVSVAYGADEKPEILSDQELKTKLIAVVKDVEVEKLLGQTAEFAECKKESKYSPNDDEKIRDAKIAKAQDCLNKKISGNPQKLQELSKNLNLQTYGLVRSKEAQDITNYLGDKMYKSMTGIDRQEADRKKYLQSLQFKNRTHVDQKDFVDMYLTQLSKSALYEVSRYCFEDLRIQGHKDKKTWSEHWGNPPYDSHASKLRDDGEPSFFKATNSKEASEVLKQVTEGISGTQIESDNMEKFFAFCTTNIKVLCKNYTDVAKTANPTIGGKSCLVMSRLQEIRKAITNTEKVQADFAKLKGSDLQIAMADPVKFYNGGSGDTTIDNLTNVTSMDMLKGGNNKNSLAEECAEKPEDSRCEAFLVEDDSKGKVLFDTAVQRTLEKEIQMARVKELKEKGDAPLKKYLEENAYYELLERVNNNKKIDNIEDEVGKIYEARKKAELAELEKAIGSRQTSDKDKSKDTKKEDTMKKNAQQLLDERARLAQVVLFNNIITSHLSLLKHDGKEYKKVGQNVSAWIKESKDQKNAQFDQSLFQNIQEKTKGADSTVKDNSIVGLDLIETILGKPQSN